MSSDSTARVRADLALFAGLVLVLSWVPLLLALVVGPGIDSGPARILFIVGTSGPTLAALLLWLAGRRRADRLGAGVVCRRAVRWFPAALIAGAAPACVAALVAGADWSAPGRVVAGVGGPAVYLIGVLVAGPLAEEFGWRGYAQPRLRRWLSPGWTAVCLGVAWAAWHLPLFWLDGTSQHAMGLFSLPAVLFFVSLVPLSYLAWWVSERLEGGVAAAVVLHASLNAGTDLLRPDTTAGYAIVAATAAVTAVAVAVVPQVRAASGLHPNPRPERV